jgi:hypothetical protein
MPRLASTINPNQNNQNVARTPIYIKCYNYGQKDQFTNIYPNQRYHTNVTPVATSTPYHSAVILGFYAKTKCSSYA